MASESEFDLNLERSPQWEDVRKEMHEAIAAGDETRVLQFLNAVPTLKLWLDPNDDTSALYKAVQKKTYRIYGLLLSRKCALKKAEEAWCYRNLSRIEKTEIRRQNFFNTEYKDSYIHYLQMASLSKTSCDVFEWRLETLFKELSSDDLISKILKVVATAPHLEIALCYDAEYVRRMTGCRSESSLGLTFAEEHIVLITGSMKEAELRGTFTHEMCHVALYLVYKNNGRPYFDYDKTRKSQYKAVLDDVRKKAKLDLIIEQAYNQDEEEELIVRVPHLLAQYGSRQGNIILNQEVPDLYNFFKNVVIPDMQTYIQNGVPGIYSEKIEKENVRLQKAFNTGKLNVKFETPLNPRDLGNMPLLILTGPELRLLEVMVHNAVLCTGQSYLFFEANQWDSTLTDVLLDNICAFVLVTIHRNRDFREALGLLSEISCVAGTKVILFVEDCGKEHLMQQVDEDAFFALNHEVNSDLKASFEHITQSCKEQVFTQCRVKLQGQDATALPQAMIIDSFLRCVDTRIFLNLCEWKSIQVGPPLHELEERVNSCFVERVCRRAVELNLEECRLDDENEAFALLGCPHDYITKLLPRFYEAKTKENLTQFEKFVLLRESHDYEPLKIVVHYRNKIVHLLQFSEIRNGLSWTKSNGRLSHLPMRGNDDYTLERLLNVNEKVIVVSGAPGMGKSVLASRLCIEMKNQDRNRWVLYVDLPQRTASVKTTSPSVGYLADLCRVQKDGLEFALFEESLNNRSPFEVVVILDAFDEINGKHRKNVLDLASFLSKTKVYKIYIFTRTVFKSDVQDALHTASYELAPLSVENQEEFFTKYREHRAQRTSTRNAAVSQQFQKLYRSLRETDNTILETPLLLRMMAEMENGEVAESDDYSSLPKIADTSIDRNIYAVHLYKMFVEYKYLVHRIEKRRENIRLYAVQEDDDALKSPFYARHGLLAMNCIFPQDILTAVLNEDELEQIKPDGRLISDVADNRLKEGFVNGLNDGIPEFIHKTFAEFFAAEYLLRKAKGTLVLGTKLSASVVQNLTRGLCCCSMVWRRRPFHFTPLL